MVVVACGDEVEIETRGEEHGGLLQLPLKQQQLQPPAAPPPVWTSQLVFPLLEAGSESTAQQPQGQQEQFETGKKGWLEDLVVKLNYEQTGIRRAPWERRLLSPLMCGPGLGSAQVGWLRWRTLGVGGTVTQAENPSPCHAQLFLPGLCLDSNVMQQVVDVCCLKMHR